MPTPTVVPPPRPLHPIASQADRSAPPAPGPRVRIVPWVDPVADPHGVHPCSRYVELYWLGIIGPSTTWLLRRLNYGLELHGDPYDLHLAETARSLGLGDKLGKNSPFRRALARLVTFELARLQGPDELAVRTRIPPLPLRHLTRLPESLQRSHRRWLDEQQLPQVERMRRRALRLATGLAEAGHDRPTIERRLADWQFHPSVAFHAARAASEAAPTTATAHGDRDPLRTSPGSTLLPARPLRPDRPVAPDRPVLFDRALQPSAPDLPDATG